MTKAALDEDSYNKEHIQSKIENMLHPDWEGVNEREFGMLSAMDDDEHLSRLRNIATESIFIDLLNTDEFLKKQDPEAVLEAYNDILEVNPKIRGKKMALRQALREYMATESLDLATIAQLEKMENDAATRQEAKDRARADQASRFAQNKQKREHDLIDLELKREAVQQRREEAHQKSVIAANELAHKKKELKSREKEFKSTQDERRERYAVEDERAKRELELKERRGALDVLDSKLKREEFEHRKEVDSESKERANSELQLRKDTFNYQKEHDIKTDTRLDRDTAAREKSVENQANQLEHQKAMDQNKMELEALAEQARQLAEKISLQEQAAYHNAALKLQAAGIKDSERTHEYQNLINFGEALKLERELGENFFNPVTKDELKAWHGRPGIDIRDPRNLQYYFDGVARGAFPKYTNLFDKFNQYEVIGTSGIGQNMPGRENQHAGNLYDYDYTAPTDTYTVNNYTTDSIDDFVKKIKTTS